MKSRLNDAIKQIQILEESIKRLSEMNDRLYRTLTQITPLQNKACPPLLLCNSCHKKLIKDTK